MKKLLLAAVLIVNCALLTVNGQTATWSWAHTAGTAFDDIPRSTAVDASGNVFICGTFNGPTITFGSITLTNAANGNQDCFVVKYNSAGVVQWANRIGGIGNEEAEAICVDGAGNVIVTGIFDSQTMVIGTTTLTDVNTNYGDFYIAKYDNSGNSIWAKSAGGSFAETGEALVCDPAGNIYVAGNFSSPDLYFGTTLLTHQGSAYTDVFLVKYSSAGIVTWAKCAGGTDVDAVTSISIDASSNLFITGYFQSASLISGSTTLTNASASTADIYILKFNSLGTILWGHSAGGAAAD